MSIKKCFVILSIMLLTVICTVGTATWVIASPAAFDAAVTDNINEQTPVTSVKLTVTLLATVPTPGTALSKVEVSANISVDGATMTYNVIAQGAGKTEEKEVILNLKPGQQFLIMTSANLKEGTYNGTTIAKDVPVTIVNYGDAEINILISNQ